jgi:hypothetical protein
VSYCRPQEKEIIGVKWIYKVKYNVDDSVKMNKAILVAKRYMHLPGINFHKIFALIARLDIMRALIFPIITQLTMSPSNSIETIYPPNYQHIVNVHSRQAKRQK